MTSADLRGRTEIFTSKTIALTIELKRVKLGKVILKGYYLIYIGFYFDFDNHNFIILSSYDTKLKHTQS